MPRYDYMPFRPVWEVESILQNLTQVCFLLLLLAEYHTLQISPAGAVVTLCLEWLTGCPGVPASSPAFIYLCITEPQRNSRFMLLPPLRRILLLLVSLCQAHDRTGGRYFSPAFVHQGLIFGPFVSIAILLPMYLVGLKQEFPAPPVVSMKDARCQIISCSFPQNADFCFQFSSQDLVLVLGVRRFPTPAPRQGGFAPSLPHKQCLSLRECLPTFHQQPVVCLQKRMIQGNRWAFMPIPGSNSGLYIYIFLGALSPVSCPALNLSPEHQKKRQ